jgi:hypothetical protein
MKDSEVSSFKIGQIRHTNSSIISTLVGKGRNATIGADSFMPFGSIHGIVFYGSLFPIASRLGSPSLI